MAARQETMLRTTLDRLPLSRPYLVVTVVAMGLFFPGWYRLAVQWLQFEQVLAHGLATLIIYLGLLVIHPPQPPSNHLRPRSFVSWAGALLLILTTLAWALLELVRIDTLAYLLLPPGLLFTSWALMGFARTLVFLPYVLLLSLSLPIWADLVPLLVSLASSVVGTWVHWFGMTALIEGNSITLPYGRLLIADGCSGIRYFAISILLGMMISILNDYRWRGWLATIAIAATLGLIANWVRITILVVIAYQTDMQSGIMTDHETMGWVVFAAFMLPALYFSPARRRSAKEGSEHISISPLRSGIAAIVIAVLIGPLALTVIQTGSSNNNKWTLALADFKPAAADTSPIPMSLPASLERTTWQSDELWVVMAQHQKSRPDEKLVPYLPPMFDRSIWHVEREIQPGHFIYRNIVSREQVALAQWYQVGNVQSWDYRKAKLLQIPAALKRESRFALVTIQVPCERQDCDKAEKALVTTTDKIQRQIAAENGS